MCLGLTVRICSLSDGELSDVESSRGRRRTEDRVRERLGRPRSYSDCDSSLAKRSLSAHRSFLRTLGWRPERLPVRVASRADRFGDVDKFPQMLLLRVSVCLLVAKIYWAHYRVLSLSCSLPPQPLLHSRATCLTSLWGHYERSLVDLNACPAYPHCSRLPHLTWGSCLAVERDLYCRIRLTNGREPRRDWSLKRGKRHNGTVALNVRLSLGSLAWVAHVDAYIRSLYMGD